VVSLATSLVGGHCGGIGRISIIVYGNTILRLIS
jgi:hypothetical protein